MVLRLHIEEMSSQDIDTFAARHANKTVGYRGTNIKLVSTTMTSPLKKHQTLDVIDGA